MNPQDQIYIDTLKDQINSGMYDHLFSEICFIDTAPKGDLVFLDIGANIGLVSIYAVPYCKRIVAVEPAPDTFSQLYQNTLNYQIIETVQVALTPENAFVPFYVNDINFTASSTINTYGKQIMVEGKTLRSLLLENNLTHVDVCKVDIEGGEGESLNFQELEHASSIIDMYFIEFHNCPKTDWQHKLGTAVSYLLRLGYHNQEIKGMSLTASK